MTAADYHIPAGDPVLETKAYRFAADVVDGKIISGKRRIQACHRFLRELERGAVDSSYPWCFDVEKGYRPIRFIEKFMVPTKGDYDKMTLLPWQHFIEANLYGWVSKKTGYRRFREALIIVGQGNGKSTLITGNGAFAVSKDGERGPEVYSLANSKDQAKIVFGECSAQIKASRVLSKHLRVTRDGIYYDPANGAFKALSTESRNLDGLNVHMGIFDEVHEYRDYKLINIIKGKAKKRRQPLIIYITTLGTVIDGPLMDFYVLGGNILDNTGAVSERAADRIFVYIDEIDEGDQPEDFTCWGKANPSLGVLLDIEDLKDEWERVKLTPAERSNFINKQLNVFTQVDELSFLDINVIRRNNKVVDLERLKGKRCYGGYDLSSTEDFTSACLEFPMESLEEMGLVFVLSHSWVPEKKMRINQEKLDWQYLQQTGRLTVVTGEYVDYNLVYQWFDEMRQLYAVQSIGYDPAKAALLVKLMEQNGFPQEVVRQGELTLTAPLDDLKERFLGGKVVHNNDPLFNWYLGNVRLTKRSAGATYLPTKQNRARKIDGFAALLNAHTEYLRKDTLFIPEDKQLTTIIDLSKAR